MRLTLEKILILKKVPLFSGLSESVLSDIIGSCEEITVLAGTDIVKENDYWNDLYIILQGHIRIHKDDITTQELNAFDTFGEMSALDAEESPFVVTATEDTLLFKISGADLYRLINEHKALERKIIQSLCRRIRQGWNESFAKE